MENLTKAESKILANALAGDNPKMSRKQGLWLIGLAIILSLAVLLIPYFEIQFGKEWWEFLYFVMLISFFYYQRNVNSLIRKLSSKETN